MALCSIIESSINDLLEKENLPVVKASGEGFCLSHSVLLLWNMKLLILKLV